MPLLVQLLGSALVLASFLGLQRGRMAPSSPLYLLANAAGSLGLAASAVLEAQWGFVCLESVWFIVSAVGLWRRLHRGRRHGCGADE